MKLIICIDKKNGMMFLGKRQSQDSLLREKIMEMASDSTLWMSSYSAGQFSDMTGFVTDDEYMTKAGENDYCFVEDKPFELTKVNEVILCHWNRQYQATVFFTEDLKANGFKKTSSENIVGSSHEKITIERYTRG